MSAEQKENGQIQAIICPSMLSCDFSNLSIEAERMVKNGADWLHMDVMDGHFVPNITIGPVVIQWLRKSHKDVFLDCHLMVTDPMKWLKPFADSGANQISYHHETQQTLADHEKIINEILRLNMKASIAIKPKTEISASSLAQKMDENAPTALQVIDKFRAKLSQVLIMTVEPGFGGQSFMDDMMPKVEFLRQKYPDLNIQVDGGVNVETIDVAAKAGANVIVSGSGVFKYKEDNEIMPGKAIQIMRDSVNNACKQSK
eukprot:CAMPEP_0197024778 /NCGR_PEP_ID=MMETSP1384-20130603/5275_1 /TAXON_ID=29189 /ORGANISM="Ammonia sp." /LENGTH=257 /DNA_ID=CAMNT_0042453225 /DNA_START=38 /DNA_END=811 /DNA_ORIENTATION=+